MINMVSGFLGAIVLIVFGTSVIASGSAPVWVGLVMFVGAGVFGTVGATLALAHGTTLWKP